MDWAGFATGSLMIFPAGAEQATMSDHQFNAIPIQLLSDAWLSLYDRYRQLCEKYSTNDG